MDALPLATAPSSPASLETRAYAKVDRRIIPFLFLCYILAYLDRVNVGFAKLQMAKDLSLSDAAFATGAGIFFIGYFLFEVPSNVMLKAIGARIWIARIMISWGLVSSAMVFVASEWSFYVMRFILGVAEAGFFPGVIYYLTLWYPSRMRASRISWFMAAIALAGVIGNPISGAILDLFSGVLGLAGWQWLFLIEGIPAILVGCVVIFYLDSSIEEAAWLTAPEKRVLAGAIATEDSAKHQHRLMDAFKSRQVYALCAIYFSLVIGLYGVTFWLPTIIKAFGVEDYFQVGLISAIPYGISTVGMLVIGRHSDRTGERRLHYIGTVTLGAAGLALSGAFASNPVISMLFLSIGTLGIIAALPLFWPMPTAFLAGTAAAAGIGIINSIGNLGGYIGPNISVWAKWVSTDPSAPLYAIALVLLAGAALTALCAPE